MAKLLIRSLHAIVVTTALAVTATASAQEPPTPESADIPTAIDEIFFSNSGPYPRNRTVFRYSKFLLGIGGFTEREVVRDAEAISRASQFLLHEQATANPTIRVPDLFNPYSTSVQFLPGTRSNAPISGSEFIFEPVLIP